MTDASPRIFRKLEKTVGRDGFDTIVGAAVAGYAALQNPSESQSRDFGRLVVPLFEKTEAETRRIVAASLSSSPRLPRALVERLMAEPVEIAAAFLLASPTLTADDLAALAARRNREITKILARRRKSEASTNTGSKKRGNLSRKLAPSEPITESPSLAAPPPLSTSRQSALLGAPLPTPAAVEPSMSPEACPAPFEEAAPVQNAREMLRGLALLGRKSPAPAASTERTDLVSLALSRDERAFYDALQRRLLLTATALAEIRADASGDDLAVALKALDIGHADALTILMMLKTRIGGDVDAFETIAKRYQALETSACAGRFGIAKAPVTAGPRLQPVYQDLASLPRAAPRPAFGRRKVAPETVRLRKDK